jgi:hypothetical protein
MIRMDTSLTKDIQRGAPGKHGKIQGIPVNRISQIDDENSLELSPIQRTELSGEDRSLDDSHDRRPTRTSAVAMLYKPTEIKRRFNKYSKVDFNATFATQSDQVRLKKEEQEAKNVYRPRNQKKDVKQKSEFQRPSNGFRDLMQYENFQDDLPDVSEKYDEEYSETYQNSKTTGKSSYWSNTRKFIVPDDSKNIVNEPNNTALAPIDGNAESVTSRLTNNASTVSGVKALVRRYGKNKHEREMALR